MRPKEFIHQIIYRILISNIRIILSLNMHAMSKISKQQTSFKTILKLYIESKVTCLSFKKF